MKKILFIAILFLFASYADAMQVTSGTFSGNGTSQGITGAGFLPELVIVWDTTTAGAGGDEAASKSSSMGASDTIISDAGVVTNCMTSLDSDGFSVGGNSRCNANGQTFRYVAFDDNGTDFFTGSYTGDGGTTKAITGVGFQPVFGMTWRAAAPGEQQPSIKFNSFPANGSKPSGGGAQQTDRIRTFDADGFTVGNDVDINTLNDVYHYAMWASGDGIQQSSYTGNSTDNRDISTNFTPEFLFVMDEASTDVGRCWIYPLVNTTTDDSRAWSSTPNGANRIQAIGTSNFQVGTHAETNTTGTYHWVVFRDTPAAAAPPPITGGFLDWFWE